MVDVARQEVVGYELTINVAGPGFSDVVRVEAETPGELFPLMIEVSGLEFERYGEASDDEYVEVRRDYIVARRIRRIVQTVQPGAVGDDERDGPSTDLDKWDRPPTEERVDDR